ncbi:MAG TPA: PQQ-binding-like beta-propeller repeat protein, partial [Candidatus Krumholzibacteria bacterium]|nr:PQQ-binding-like beta-propeller repeat protein [Candidatus Krumholzibacteria bacterium]
MSHDVTFIPAGPETESDADLVYREHSSAGRGLVVLMQDTSAHASASRTRFLLACFRDTIARYLETAQLQGTQAFLRERILAFESIARGVDTRLDDFEGLGIYVALRERDTVYLLCARGASTRVRWRGVFVPLSTPGVDGVTELPIETARSQHDLFTPTLPESLALYRIRAGADVAARELLLGGAADDVAASVDALEHTTGRLPARVEVDRVRHTVIMLSVESCVSGAGKATAQPLTKTAGERPHARRTAGLAITGAVILIAGVAGLGYWRAAVDDRNTAVNQTVLKETPPPPLEKREVPDTSLEQTPPVEAKADEKKGFGVAWQQSFRGAVTSSPVVAGDAVVFGGRDGKVYSIGRSDGNRQWAYSAQGGVGASPVFQSGVVVAADYAGNVVALRAGSGTVIWKRALREKIVSTPAVSGERIAVGTVNGRVYVLSLESGRVLWKFATRGPIRG